VTEVVVVGWLEKQSVEWRTLGAARAATRGIDHGVVICSAAWWRVDRELFLDRKCKWLAAEVMRLLKIWEIEQLGLDQGSLLEQFAVHQFC